MTPRRVLNWDTVLELGSEPLGDIVVDGRACRIRVGKNVRLEADIVIHGDVSSAAIHIEDNCVLSGCIRLVRGDDLVVRVGAGTTFNDVSVTMHESGAIRFGRDCMLSTGIQMDTSDMHPIYDRFSGERLNPPRDINVADRVWIGTRSLLLKGATIGRGAIIGAGSIVSGEIPEHVLAAGTPARVIRENVVWARELDETPQLVPRPKTQAQPEQA